MCAANATVAVAHPGPGLVVTSDGTIYFTFGPTHRLWKVDPDGQAEAIVTGALDEDFRVPHHLALDEKGQLYTASDAGGFVWRVAADGALTQIYPPDDWDERGVVGLGGDPFTLAPDGRIVAVTPGGRDAERRIHRISLDGAIEPLAGGPPGFADGVGGDARFGSLHGSCFAWDSSGNLYLTDDGRRVRRITPDGLVSTLAGGGERGMRDGPATEAQFEYATGIVVSPDGSVFVADSGARRIRKISTDGVVTTIAGTGERGSADGAGAEATFDGPVGVALDQAGNLFVLEYTRKNGQSIVQIRRIDLDHAVTTHARILDP